ncbi:MAG: hypothetical protein K9G76_10195 [Bacteroidales bacterium]|nr:hypothetical protein [Bacteroidales bacterium]MCF8404071.1 hypothetical protein [Bacteroidales bacterium]
MQKQFIKILLVAICFSVSFVYSQDVILLNSGMEILTKVTEIGKSEIKYKEYSNLNGPDYVIKKNKVKKIVFENGKIDDLTGGVKNQSYNHNAFAYHIFDVVYNDFSFSYEHISKSGNLGIKIPIAIGYNLSSYGSRDYNNVFFTGIGFNIYPTGQHRVNYFMGPELNIGLGQDEDSYYNYFDGSRIEETKEFFYGRLIVNNGMSYNPVPNFRVSFVVGVGVRYYDINSNYYYHSGLRSTVYVTGSMGYMF